MERVQFANRYFYHIYNRGVEKRNIFLDRNDYIRFIHDLYEFNDIRPANQYSRCNVGSPTSNIRERKRLVDIICFSLMPNHYHLLLKQISDGGITSFLRKLGTGYTNAFNLRRNRVGPLFQGKFKAVPIKTDEQLIHLSRYIHLNPVELKEPQWKEKGIRAWQSIDKFLIANYRWSSYPDFVGQDNFPSVINGKDFILEYFNGDILEYKNFVREWTERDVENISNLIFE